MSEQLSSAVRPESYDINWHLDFDSFRFTGEVTIAVSVAETVPMIRMHCEHLEIRRCVVTSGSSVVPADFTCSEGELRIRSSSDFAPGSYSLTIGFSGELDDSLSGLYRSSYSDSSGATAWLATTQFEAPYARKAFPCFDEPQFKATFTVAIDIPSGMTGISNMPVTSEKPAAEGRKIVRFEASPRMSTYLLYIGAGMFDYIEDIRDGRTLRVYGINGTSAQGTFALTFAADTLAFFEKYTGVPYPLPKLDLIAIPDFAAGAMENWGAITFREALLFCDEKTTSFARKKRIADIIAHELWHQWSGNLVTMQWWDDLWLNEAFATFIAYKAVDKFYPDWHIWDTFTGGRMRGAFEMDMLSSTHPIAVPVETPNQIEEIFDSISYGKGASVLRMIEAYIGEENFRKGISVYLSTFAYKNATASDLWNILEAHSGKPVKDILSAWVAKPGFPLVTVSRKGDALVAAQERFGTGATPEDLWPVPLTWLEDSTEKSALMDEKTFSIASGTAVCKCNIRQTGFYRVLYSNDLYSGFGDMLTAHTLSEHDRWGLLNDLWSAVYSGYAGLSSLLEFMSYFSSETSRFVLGQIDDICETITLHLLLPGDGTALYERFVTPFTPQFSRLGWDSTEGDRPEDRQLRSLVLHFLLRAGNADVAAGTRERALAWLDGGALNPDLRNVCLQGLSKTADRNIFDRVRAAYEVKVGAEEKLSLLGSMANYHTPELLQAYLDYSLSDRVRRQDLRTVFAAAAGNTMCSEVFFPWVRENWGRLSELSSSYFIFAGLLQVLITTAPDRETLDEIRTFVDDNTTGFEKTKANSFENAELALRFRERESGFTG